MSRYLLLFALVAATACTPPAENPTVSSAQQKAGWVRVVNLSSKPIQVSLAGQAIDKPLPSETGTDFRKLREGEVAVEADGRSIQAQNRRGQTLTVYVTESGEVMSYGDLRAAEAKGGFLFRNLTDGNLTLTNQQTGADLAGSVAPGEASPPFALPPGKAAVSVEKARSLELDVAKGEAGTFVAYDLAGRLRLVYLPAPRLILQGASGSSAAGG